MGDIEILQILIDEYELDEFYIDNELAHGYTLEDILNECKNNE